MVIEQWIQTRQVAGQRGSVGCGPMKEYCKKESESINRAAMPECRGAVMLRAQLIRAPLEKDLPMQARISSSHPRREQLVDVVHRHMHLLCRRASFSLRHDDWRQTHLSSLCRCFLRVLVVAHRSAFGVLASPEMYEEFDSSGR